MVDPLILNPLQRMPLPQRQDQQHPKRRNTHAPDKRLRLRELRGKKSMPKNSRPGQKGIFKSVAKDRMMTYVVSYREAQTPARGRFLCTDPAAKDIRSR